MERDDRLAAPPDIAIEVVNDRLPDGVHGPDFLSVRRLELRNRYADGTTSRSYRYDVVERQAIDAVAMVLYVEAAEGPLICLRTCLRPPLAFRADYNLPLPERHAVASQWEVPAGLVAEHERGEDGLRECAAREALEEAGFDLAPGSFSRLGHAVTLSPGVLGERLHYFAAEVRLDAQGTPTEDGCPVEERGEVRFVRLSLALAAIEEGRLSDIKTETAIRRFRAARATKDAGR